MTIASPPVMALRARNVSVQVGSKALLQGASLDLPPGLWVCVCGPNGAGKSTLLRTLAGLLPFNGSLQLQGEDSGVLSATLRAQRLSWMGQAEAVPDDLLVSDVVQLGRWPHRAVQQNDPELDAMVVQQCMQALGLQQLHNRTMHELSGGECQRALLARAMAVQAPVMLFDEPLNHLDVPHQQSWLRWLRSRLQAGAAALTVMHELNQAMAADQLLVMQSGKVLHQGAPADEKTRQALQEAFGQCLDFHALDTNGTAPRWVVLPRTDS
jgi:iron complex transport system ATP-binding protein